MIASTRHRFTVEDYHRMAGAGVLTPDARVESINGELIERAPIGPFHGDVVSRSARRFNPAAAERFHVSPRNPLKLDDQSEPEPDILLAKLRSDDYTLSHPETDFVILPIEMSDRTLDQDRDTKVPTYGRAGIPEVWIVNLIDLTVEVHRDPHFYGYGSQQVIAQGLQISPAAFEDVVVDVAELLRREGRGASNRQSDL